MSGACEEDSKLGEDKSKGMPAKGWILNPDYKEGGYSKFIPDPKRKKKDKN